MLDCIADALSPEVLEQALEQALTRGLFDATAVRKISDGIERLKR